MTPSRATRGLIWQSGCLLRIASLIVPKAQRKDWYARRRAEVWHWVHFLAESGRLDASTRLEVIKHVWGAYSDATWRRFNRDKTLKLLRERPRGARFCLLTISSLLLLAIVGTGFAPTIRSSFSRLPYRDPGRLVHVSFTNNFIRIHTDSLFLLTSRWAGQQSQSAEAVSAYSWEPATVAAGGRSIDVISARVSPDFFETLGVNAGLGRVFHAGDESQCFRCIILSNQLWWYGFHHDPAIVGKRVVYQGTASTVVGVLPKQFVFVSPEISVWRVAYSDGDAFTTDERAGIVMRLRPGSTLSQASGEFAKQVRATSGIELSPIKTRVRQGTNIYILFTLLALFGSLVLLAYRLVNSGGPNVHFGLRNNLRWWMFFAAKTILLLTTCFVASLEGTRRVFLAFSGVVPPFAGAVCTWLFIVTTVLALTWSLHDQHRRCRFCLKRLGHAAYVGAPASLLLDWWGTELVCSQGHGMLHVPEMQASWLEKEHWTPLDDSWKPLFDSEDVNA